VVLLELNQEVRDTAIVVSAAGEVDSGTAAMLVTHLDGALKMASDHPTQLLIVELARVTYFGSAGLNALLECYEQGNYIGVGVRVVAPNAEVRRVIEVTQLDGVLRPYGTVTAAISGDGQRQWGGR
jgi:anti-anti-sigma factor